MPSLIGQLTCFVIVGAVAALTHWSVAVSCVSMLGVPPLLANVVGWLIAFIASFAGHYQLTFRHQHAPFGQALRRFFVVSATGFSINELAYAWLLHVSSLRYDVLLALILIAIAFLTFILGKIWAFRRRTQAAPPPG
ncbi:MAG: GtrA family protein [Candidimonas sp.]